MIISWAIAAKIFGVARRVKPVGLLLASAVAFVAATVVRVWFAVQLRGVCSLKARSRRQRVRHARLAAPGGAAIFKLTVCGCASSTVRLCNRRMSPQQQNADP